LKLQKEKKLGKKEKDRRANERELYLMKIYLRCRPLLFLFRPKEKKLGKKRKVGVRYLNKVQKPEERSIAGALRFTLSAQLLRAPSIPLV
jgi:hypothetical protein